MSTATTYGDITPRTAAHAMYPLLVRGQEEMILENLGQVYVLPDRSTKTAKFRRYEALALSTSPLVEGTPPTGKKVTFTDYTVNLDQYGDFVEITDVIEDTHEDPILQEFTKIIVQQMMETMETLRWNVVRAGVNVIYGNGTQRTDVNTPITLDVQRKATMALMSQRGKMITKAIAPDADYRTEPTEPGYVAVCGVYCANDVRNIQGYINPKQYTRGKVYPNEIGAVENVRYVQSTLFTPFADAGAAKGSMRSTTGTNADVFPIIFFAENAYGIVPLKGKGSATAPIVKNIGSSGTADPINQIGTVGWKMWQASVILNDLWMVRVEVAATA